MLTQSSISMPQHVAIVMDGNGRWAKNRDLPRAAGHRAGSEVVQHAVEFCVKKNIKVLTLFALSVENLKYRPKLEIELLLSLFVQSLEKKTEELNKENVRIRIIGDRAPFDEKLLATIERCEQLTAHNTGLNLVIAINYSGRWDMVQATEKLIQDLAEKKIPVEITEESLQKYLCLSDLPVPDLLIRTGGEQRISNFMLWQFAYTEIFFTPVFWPDFNDPVFEQALSFYQSRERRFGYTSEQLKLKSIR